MPRRRPRRSWVVPRRARGHAGHRGRAAELREYLPKEASDFQEALGAMVGRPFRTFSRRRDGSEIPTEMVLGVVETDTGQVFTGTVRRRNAPSLSRWSALTATLFDTLKQSDPAGSATTSSSGPWGASSTATWRRCGRSTPTAGWSAGVSGRTRDRSPGTVPVARSPEAFGEVSLPAYVLGTGEPLWVPDLAADNRFAPGPRRARD